MTRASRLSAVMALLGCTLAMLLLAGCAAEPAAPPTKQQQFAAKVAQADQAWDAGDAEDAFALYTEALKIDPPSDADGAVKAKQEAAKNLTLSRRILAGTSPGPESIGEYAQAATYATADSTESAAARRGLATILDEFRRSMQKDVTALRKRIKANKSVELPVSVFLVDGIGDGWQSDVAQTPGPVGESARTAVKELRAAADSVGKAFDRTDADEALADLKRAESHLDAAQKAIDQLDGP